MPRESKITSTWKQLGSTAEVIMGQSVYVGLAVNSNSGEDIATATFDHVTGLPLNPRQMSVGPAPKTGSLTVDGSVYAMTGNGYDIWDPPHQFHFAYDRLDGAGAIIARITSQQAKDANAKAGIMIRDSLDPDAQFVDLVHSRANGAQFQWRRIAEGIGPKTAGYDRMALPFWLKLVRHYSSIKVTLDNIPDVAPGQLVTAVGYLASKDGVTQLVDATCTVNSPVPGAKEGPTWSHPLLDMVKVSESSGHPGNLDIFRVRGVVTFAGEVDGQYYLSVQDHTGGTFVQPRGNVIKQLVQVGQLIEVHSDPGWHPPEPGFFADNILNLGPGMEPRPLRHPLEYLLPKRGEGTWIEIEGMVRSVSRSGLIQVKQNGEIFSVHINQVSPETLASWIDSLVRIRGVISFPSEKEPLLLVPSLKNIEIIEPAAANPFAVPVQELSSLTAAKLINKSLHRVKISGTVTYLGGDFIHIQEGGVGARIQTDHTAAVQSGDTIESVGFPDLAVDQSLIISNAMIRLLTHGKPVEPIQVTFAEILSGKFGGKLVRLKAMLSGTNATDTDQTLELIANQQIFRASLAGQEQLLASPPPGSLLEVTGVCILEAANLAGPRLSADLTPILPIRLLLRSPADAVVLEKPRWWVIKRTLLFTGVAALAGLIAIGWIHLLRRRIAQRTAELANAMAKLRKETQMAATLAERDRLAGEIHDSLAQGFSGLLLQLDTTAKLQGCSAEVRSGLGLARNMVAFSRTEVQHAVWDLQSPLLEDGDLGTALAKMVDQLNTGTPRISIEMTGSVRRLPSIIEHHLLRIAQEAITNSIKHARANVIEITVEFSTTALRLSVRDDGCGFVPAQVLTGGLGHFGLRSLRGRAKKIEGEMTIASEPGCGTTVSIHVPHVSE